MTWAPDYCTLAELRTFARIDDTADDTILSLAITAASRAIDGSCGRQFGSSTGEERLYTARYDRNRSAYVVDIDDTFDDTATVESDGTAVTDFTPLPLNAVANGKPWTMYVFGVTVSTVEGDIAVTGDFGWTDVPDTIKAATLLQASRLYKRRDAPFGVAGSPDLGSELRLLAKLDPDVAVMVGPYRRYW
jgi:uncharacterized phiE125 gp8 family phage protein